MASLLTNAGLLGIANGTISYGSDTIQARLAVAGSADPDVAVLTTYTKATGSTDVTLASKSVSKDDALDIVKFVATSPLTWTGLSHTGNATLIVIFKFVTNDADSIPIAIIDIADQSLTGATQATYTMDTSYGYFYLDTVP